MKNRKILITSIIVFFIAFIPRIIGLEKVGILSDEKEWINRGTNYLSQIKNGNFIQATKNFERHPGIPAAILIGTSFNFFSDDSQKEYAYNMTPPWKYSLKIMGPLSAARLPIVFLGSFSAAILFFFVWCIWKNYSLALVASLFLALDPFHISLSRMAHQDVALSFFFMLTIFTYYLGQKKNKNYLRLLAGVFWGFAFLTKIVAILIPVILFIWKAVEKFRNKKDRKEALYKKIPVDLIDIVALIIGISMFFVFYTSIWENPIAGFKNHLLMNLGAENLKDVYFYFGKVENEPSFTFYFTQIFIRLPEITLITLFVGIFWGIYQAIKKKFVGSITVLLVINSFLVWIALSLPGKMKDRYILPIWPFIMILAASGFIVLLNLLFKKFWQQEKIRYGIISLAVIAGFAWQLTFFYPYYFLYYNKFIGDISNVEKITLISRGEGMKEAAEYLNNKENSKDLKVIATYEDSFTPYFKGTTNPYNKKEWQKGKTPDIDYVVFFIRGVQKRNFGILNERFVNNDSPEKIINLKGLNVAYVYKVKIKK